MVLILLFFIISRCMDGFNAIGSTSSVPSPHLTTSVRSSHSQPFGQFAKPLVGEMRTPATKQTMMVIADNHWDVGAVIAAVVIVVIAVVVCGRRRRHVVRLLCGVDVVVLSIVEISVATVLVSMVFLVEFCSILILSLWQLPLLSLQMPYLSLFR